MNELYDFPGGVEGLNAERLKALQSKRSELKCGDMVYVDHTSEGRVSKTVKIEKISDSILKNVNFAYIWKNYVIYDGDRYWRITGDGKHRRCGSYSYSLKKDENGFIGESTDN